MYGLDCLWVKRKALAFFLWFYASTLLERNVTGIGTLEASNRLRLPWIRSKANGQSMAGRMRTRRKAPAPADRLP
jgi:hypothetical protein